MTYTLEQLNEMMQRNGGWLYLSGTGITVSEKQKVKRLHNGDYCHGRWIYADGILTHILRWTHSWGKRHL